MQLKIKQWLVRTFSLGWLGNKIDARTDALLKLIDETQKQSALHHQAVTEQIQRAIEQIQSHLNENAGRQEMIIGDILAGIAGVSFDLARELEYRDTERSATAPIP